jgi:hypothetical protein
MWGSVTKGEHSVKLHEIFWILSPKRGGGKSSMYLHWATFYLTIIPCFCYMPCILVTHNYNQPTIQGVPKRTSPAAKLFSTEPFPPKYIVRNKTLKNTRGGTRTWGPVVQSQSLCTDRAAEAAGQSHCKFTSYEDIRILPHYANPNPNLTLPRHYPYSWPSLP